MTGPTAVCCGSGGYGEAVRRGSGGRGVQAVQDGGIGVGGVLLGSGTATAALLR
jgi:hypothetical protein